jgi:hypothetical protein
LGKGLVGYDGNAAWNCEASYIRAIKEGIGSNVSNWEPVGRGRDDNVTAGACVSGDGKGAVVGYVDELRLEDDRQDQREQQRYQGGGEEPRPEWLMHLEQLTMRRLMGPARIDGDRFRVHGFLTPGLNGVGPRTLECEQVTPPRVQSRPLVVYQGPAIHHHLR